MDSGACQAGVRPDQGRVSTFAKRQSTRKNAGSREQLPAAAGQASRGCSKTDEGTQDANHAVVSGTGGYSVFHAILRGIIVTTMVHRVLQLASLQADCLKRSALECEPPTDSRRHHHSRVRGALAGRRNLAASCMPICTTITPNETAANDKIKSPGCEMRSEIGVITPS